MLCLHFDNLKSEQPDARSYFILSLFLDVSSRIVFVRTLSMDLKIVRNNSAVFCSSPKAPQAVIVFDSYQS